MRDISGAILGGINIRVMEGVISATLGRSQDFCRGARSLVEGERCVVGSRSLFKRLEVNEEEEEGITLVRALLRSASERRVDNLEGVKDFRLKAKARI